jgi:predicted Zn finger-like uncharacterized protein
MRLICPNCGAQYEVPDEVIPENGRDVQCSNCGDTWFQHHPSQPVTERQAEPEAEQATDHDQVTWDAPENEPATGNEANQVNPAGPQPAPVPPQNGPNDDDTPEAAADTPTGPARRQLDPAIADVLREEADFEREARAAKTGGGLETQPDLGLGQDHDDEDWRGTAARDRMARLRGQEANDKADAPASTPEAQDIDPSSRRNLLPDIDEINSSLDAGTVGSDQKQASSDTIDDLQPAPRRKSGFRRGVFYAVLLALILLAVYYVAPQIADRVPALAGPLETYVEQVNGLRIMLDEQFGWARDWLNKMSSAPAEAGE